MQLRFGLFLYEQERTDGRRDFYARQVKHYATLVGRAELDHSVLLKELAAKEAYIEHLRQEKDRNLALLAASAVYQGPGK